MRVAVVLALLGGGTSGPVLASDSGEAPLIKEGQHVARDSGGKWTDPDDRMLARIKAEEKKRLRALEKTKK